MHSVNIYQIPLKEYLRLENGVLSRVISPEEKYEKLRKAFLLSATDHEISMLAYTLHSEGKAIRAEQPHPDLLTNHYGMSYSVLSQKLYDLIKKNVENMTPAISNIKLSAFYYLQFHLDTDMTIVITDLS
jgi:hypothetical protein